MASLRNIVIAILRASGWDGHCWCFVCQWREVVTAMREWKPTEAGPKVQGVSAYRIALWQTGLNLSIFVLTVALFAGMLIDRSGYADSPILGAIFASICLVIFTDIVLAIIFWRIDRKERAQGCTTLRGDKKDWNEIDIATGYVIRSSGEGFLAPQERQRRRALIEQGLNQKPTDPTWLI